MTDTTNALRAPDESDNGWIIHRLKMLTPFAFDQRVVDEAIAALAAAQPEAKPEERAYETPGSEQVAGDVHRGEAKPEAVEVMYEVWQDDGESCEWMASASEEAEAMRYAHQFAEDGPVLVKRVISAEVCRIKSTRQAQGSGEDGR